MNATYSRGYHRGGGDLTARRCDSRLGLHYCQRAANPAAASLGKGVAALRTGGAAPRNQLAALRADSRDVCQGNEPACQDDQDDAYEDAKYEVPPPKQGIADAERAAEKRQRVDDGGDGPKRDLYGHSFPPSISSASIVRLGRAGVNGA